MIRATAEIILNKKSYFVPYQSAGFYAALIDFGFTEVPTPGDNWVMHTSNVEPKSGTATVFLNHTVWTCTPKYAGLLHHNAEYFIAGVHMLYNIFGFKFSGRVFDGLTEMKEKTEKDEYKGFRRQEDAGTPTQVMDVPSVVPVEYTKLSENCIYTIPIGTILYRVSAKPDNLKKFINSPGKEGTYRYFVDDTELEILGAYFGDREGGVIDRLRIITPTKLVRIDCPGVLKAIEYKLLLDHNEGYAIKNKHITLVQYAYGDNYEEKIERQSFASFDADIQKAILNIWGIGSYAPRFGNFHGEYTLTRDQVLANEILPSVGQPAGMYNLSNNELKTILSP